MIECREHLAIFGAWGGGRSPARGAWIASPHSGFAMTGRNVVLRGDAERVVRCDDGERVVRCDDGERVVLRGDGERVVLRGGAENVVLHGDGEKCRSTR